ncbi:MAG: hypothetical protein ABI980_11595 [Nitrospirota bacterium]
MDTIRKEVRDLITLNERIQSALIRGERLTETEMGIIRMCSAELLGSMSSPDGSSPEWKGENGHRLSDLIG